MFGLKLNKNVKIYLMFLLLAVVSYWGIAFLVFNFKYDMLDVVFPWKFYAGECLTNGHFPFWNPYQQLGYPFYADLQYPVWYAEELIIGYLFGYNLYTLHFLFIGYLSLAGYGMHLLCSKFASTRAAIIGGMAYMLCGFFTAHTQSMTLIIGAVWLPLVLYHYLNFTQYKKPVQLAYTAFFLFLMISGGYQGFTVILGYILIALFFAELIRLIKSKETFFRWVLLNAALLVLVVGFSAIILVILKQVAPFASRLEGIPLSVAQEDPIAWASIYSLILPMTSTTNELFPITDISMRSIYIGFIPLVFAFYGLRTPKKITEKIFLAFGVILFLGAWGESTPVREWLYRFIPMMDLFRFSSILSYYLMLVFILFAAKGIDHFIQNKEDQKVHYAFFTSSLVLIGLVIWSITSHPEHLLQSFSFTNEGFHSLALQDKVFIQAFFLFIIVSIGTFFLFKRKVSLTLLGSIVFAEMFFAVQLNSPYTAVDIDYSPVELQEKLSELPKGFPIPNNKVALKDNLQQTEWTFPLWRNTSIYQKNHSFSAYTSFLFNAYDKFLGNEQLQTTQLSKPLLYFEEGGRSTIDVLNYSPNEIECYVKTEKSQNLIFQQSDFKGWQAYLNGKPVEHSQHLDLLMKLKVSAGNHYIKFSYTNTLFTTWLLVSYFIFLVVLIFIIGYQIKYKQQSCISLILLFIIACFVWRFLQPNAQEKITKNREVLLNQIDVAPDIISAPSEIDFTNLTESYFTRFESPNSLNNLADFINSSNKDSILFYNENRVIPPQVLEIIEEKYPNKESLGKEFSNSLIKFKKGRETRKRIVLLNQGFEGNDFQLIDTVQFLIGNQSLKMTSSDEFAFKQIFENSSIIDFEDHKWRINGRLAMKSAKDNQLIMVVEVFNNEGRYHYKAIPLYASQSDWEYHYITNTLPKKMKKTDRISVYFWNKDKNELNFDDFKLTLTPVEYE